MDNLEMPTKHRIVLSAENNPYVAWQAKLFYFSCVSRLDHQPIIIVHELQKEWHPDFYDLVKAGAIVRTAPNYRAARNYNYSPRNTAGTLLHAAELSRGQHEFIVLCDPDMIFVRQPEFPECLCGDYYSYMSYDREEIDIAASKLGVTREMIDAQKNDLCCGVPYVIPVENARRLAETWLEAIDAFPIIKRGDMMHAFGLAAVKLGLKVALTHTVDHNYWQDERVTREVIHFCYGDDTWSKRHYFTEEQVRRVWQPPVQVNNETILGEIVSQIREARDFYHGFHF